LGRIHKAPQAVLFYARSPATTVQQKHILIGIFLIYYILTSLSSPVLPFPAQKSAQKNAGRGIEYSI